MASSSGTLLQYFKQPLKKPDNSVIQQEADCIIIDDNQTPSTSTKRKNELNADGLGKRRKLSLSSLRAKQSNTVPLEPARNSNTSKTTAELSNDIIDTESNMATVVSTIKLQSVKDVLFNHKKANRDNDQTSGHQSKECQKKDKKQTSDQKNKCQKKNKRRTSDQTKKCQKTDENQNVSDRTRYEGQKTDSKLTSDQTKKCQETTKSCSQEEINKKIIARVKRSLNITDSIDDVVEVAVSPNSRTSKPRRSVNVLSDSDEEMITTEISCPKEESELNTSRRSSRVRKPVERFTVDISDHEDDDKKQQRVSKRSNKSASKKNKENKPPSDDILLIDDIPPPRKSVSSVLGTKGKAVQKKPSISSTSMMQEAKKLMQASRSSPIHMACPTSVPNAMVTTTVNSTIKKLEEETVVWPKISHVNISKEIIIYPMIKLDIYKKRDMTVEIRTDESYKVQLDTDSVQCILSSERCDKGYDGCVAELATNHSRDNVEDAIEYYSNITSREKELQNGTDTRLWAQLYCPTDYRYCIGNKSTTKQLYKWLDGWKTKLLNVKKRRDSSSGSDSDFVAWDEEEEKPWLDNVVLLSGPNGAGKSGAIATCAAQLGYKVMELNASSERTGKNLAELFSEAAQSHSVTGKQGAADFTKIIADISARNTTKQKGKKNGLDNFFKRRDGKENAGDAKRKGKKKEIINIDDSSEKPRKKKKAEKQKTEKQKTEKPLSLKKRSGQGKLSFGKSTAVSSTKSVREPEDLGSKVEKLSLIVLEEIDIAFEDDRGFYAAIVALMRIAKRPIILTSNNPNLYLPTDAEFLVLKFNPPKTESIMLQMDSLSLSYNNYIPPYQLQQYIQYHSADLHKVISNLEFLNISSNKKAVSELSLTAHLLGVSNSLNSQQAFLEQTQSLNLQFVYLNLNKLLRSRSSKECTKDATLGNTESGSLRELVTCHDTFLYLDLLSPKSHCREFALFPSRASPALTEQHKVQEYSPGEHQDYCSDELLSTRVQVELQLLNFLNLPPITISNTRLNKFKLKEGKVLSQVTEVQRSVNNAVLGMNLLSRCVVDELSALRQICRTEKVKEDSRAKRRFKHYLEREIEVKDRELLSKFWLGS